MAKQKENLKVQYCFLSDVNDPHIRKKKYNCYLFDISLKGVGLLTDYVFNLGSIIYIRINRKALNTKKDLEVVGRVVHTSPYGNKFIMGIEFVNISNRNKNALEDFISGYLYERSHRFIIDDSKR